MKCVEDGDERVEDGLTGGGDDDTRSGEDDQAAQDKRSACNRPRTAEKSRTDGGNRLLDGRLSVAVRDGHSLFQKDPSAVDGQDHKGDEAKGGIEKYECAKDEAHLVRAVKHSEIGDALHSLDQCAKEREEENGQPEGDKAHEDQWEREPAAAADVVQPPHGGWDGEGRQENGGEEEDEGKPCDQENPERGTFLTKECCRCEVGQRQEGGDSGKAQERCAAAECSNGQRIVAARQSAAHCKYRVIHNGVPQSRRSAGG